MSDLPNYLGIAKEAFADLDWEDPYLDWEWAVDDIIDDHGLEVARKVVKVAAGNQLCPFDVDTFLNLDIDTLPMWK